MFDQLKIGGRLEISMLSAEPEREPIRYLSKLEDKLEDGHVIVYMPIQSSRFVKLPPEKKYELVFYGTGMMILFKAKIIKYTRKEGFGFIVFKLLSKGERAQRRAFFRYNCLLPLEFAKKGEIIETEFGVEIPEKYQGLIQDISGGGIRFVANERLEIDEKIVCDVTLQDKTLVLEGDIVYVADLKESSNYKHQYRVKFNAKEGEREEIVQFIFDMQRKSIQVGR